MTTKTPTIRLTVDIRSAITRALIADTLAKEELELNKLIPLPKEGA